MRRKIPLFVGIDVSKERLDIHYHPVGRASSCTPTDEQLDLLVITLQLCGVERVVVESTGGYCKRVVAALRAGDVPTFVVQPQRIRKLAQALGVYAKTDTLDAEVIAKYAATATFVDRPAPSAATQTLRDLVIRRQQLVDSRVDELTRREHLPKVLEKGAQKLMRVLDGLIEEVEAAMRTVVKDDPDLTKRAAAIRVIKGVGEVVSCTLLALVPELGTASHKAIAALVGVAPFNDDSGKRAGKRHIRGGRKRVRGALYMAARAAVRYEPALKAHFDRLKAAGKPDRVAITAAMRKLVVIANAKTRDALNAPLTAAEGA